jgi:hypothetical protein
MLPSLKVKIGADTSELDRKLGDTQARLRRFAKIGAAATAAAAVATAALFVRTAAAIDAQAKLAQSLGTTVKSMQILERAGELAGVNMSGIGQATKDLTRRLSQAASGTGPAVDALKALNLSANDLMKMPLDERVLAINEAIREFVPAAQRAAVAGMLFGEEGSIAMGRLDSETLRQATKDIDDFGVAIGEDAADQIERANDALSRIKLVFTGMANKLTVALAPAVEMLANAFTNVMRIGQPFRELLEQIAGRVIAYGSILAIAAAAWGVYRAAVLGATIAQRLFNGALVLTRAALIRTGIGAVVVLLGELVFRAVAAAEKFGGVGKVIKALWEVFKDRFERMTATATVWGDNFQIMMNGLDFSFQSALISMTEKFFGFANATAKTMNDIFNTGFSTDMGLSTIEDMIDGLTLSNDELVKLMVSRDAALERLDKPLVRLADLLTAVDEVTDDLGTTTDDVTTDMAAGFDLASGAAENLKKVLTEAQARAKSAAEMIGSKMEEAMMSMVDGTKSAQDAFKSMARSIILELYRIFVVKKITGFLANAIGAAFGVPAAAMAPAAVSYEGGGYTGRGPRSGGVDGRGGFPAIVHPNETIVDHNKAGSSMGGSVIVQQTINISTGVQQTVRNEIRQLMPQIAESAKAAVVDSKRRGGSYGRAFA